jgi:hypothetical protein
LITTVIISTDVDSEDAVVVEVGAAGAEGAVGEVGTVDELELFDSIIGCISGSFDMYESEPEPVSFETNTGEDTGDVST